MKLNKESQGNVSLLYNGTDQLQSLKPSMVCMDVTCTIVDNLYLGNAIRYLPSIFWFVVSITKPWECIDSKKNKSFKIVMNNSLITLQSIGSNLTRTKYRALKILMRPSSDE